MEGWICPRCQVVHAPFVAGCDCQPPTHTATRIVGNAAFCTCGLNTTGECPIHSPQITWTTSGGSTQ